MTAITRPALGAFSTSVALIQFLTQYLVVLRYLVLILAISVCRKSASQSYINSILKVPRFKEQNMAAAPVKYHRIMRFVHDFLAHLQQRPQPAAEANLARPALRSLW